MRAARRRRPLGPGGTVFAIVVMVGVIIFAVVRCNADPGVYATAMAAAEDLNTAHFEGFGPTSSDVYAAVNRHLPQMWLKGSGYVDVGLEVAPVGDNGYEISDSGRYPACLTVTYTGFADPWGSASAADGHC